MILKTRISENIARFSQIELTSFLLSIPDNKNITKEVKNGMLYITILGDRPLQEDIIRAVKTSFSRATAVGFPGISREYIFSSEEIASAKLHNIGGSTAPVHGVQTKTVASKQACPHCRSGSQVIGASMTLLTLPKRRLVQTMEYDVLFATDLVEELVSAGCARSDFIPVQSPDGTTPFHLIWPLRHLPPMSPQSEGYAPHPDRPCSVCNRNYAGAYSVQTGSGPGLIRYSRETLDTIPEDECGLYSSWEYFGGEFLKDGESDYPPDVFFGRPMIFATKKCFEIVRGYCKKQLKSDPVLPEA